MRPAWQHEMFRVDCISHSLGKAWLEEAHSLEPEAPCLRVCLWLIPWRHPHMQHCIISGFSLCNSMLKFYRNKEFPCKVMPLQLREESIERGLESFPEKRCQVCWILNHPEHILMGLTVFIHRNSSTKSQVQLLSTSPSTFLFIFFNLSIHKAFCL